MEKQEKISIMLDSGAFSAWTKNAEINIDEYCKFCLDNLDIIDYIVNLDIIPGKWGQKYYTEQEIENSAAGGYKNYEYMISKGIPKEKLMHVFHQNENFKWLKKMVKEIPYIGISPSNDKTTNQKAAWLDQCMQYVCDENGYPKVKFHGFGVTSHKLMVRYPWFSCDSTSWIVTSRTGSIFVPHKEKGNFVYHKAPWKIALSDKSSKKSDAGQHINNLSPAVKKILNEYIKLKGFTIKELSEKYVKRDLINLEYFKDFEASQPEWPWPFKCKTGMKCFL